MITRDTTAFFAQARTLAPDFGPATPQAAFLVAPEGFCRAEQSAQDNRYMAQASRFDAECALTQHRALQRAMSQVLPTVCFAGDAQTPDAVFPNNVFATAAGRYVVGRMRHPCASAKPNAPTSATSSAACWTTRKSTCPRRHTRAN